MEFKPLMILPPAPERWKAIERLLAEESESRRRDLELRIAQGVPGAEDAFVIIPDGAKALALACIRRRGAVGVFGQLYTHPDFRGRGFCRRLTQALLSWWDMTRGRWLYSHTRLELHEGFLTHFGFEALRTIERDGLTYRTLLRTPLGVTREPYRKPKPDLEIRAITRTDWPLMVAMLQYLPGADPRVGDDENALTAENAALEMIEQQEQQRGRMLGAFAGRWLQGVVGLALGAPREPTHALHLPFDRSIVPLRRAAESLARELGHFEVRWPMEALLGRIPSGGS